MADCYINVQSTSATSATTSPLLLNETDLLRLQFNIHLQIIKRSRVNPLVEKFYLKRSPRMPLVFQVMSVTKV